MIELYSGFFEKVDLFIYLYKKTKTASKSGFS